MLLSAINLTKSIGPKELFENLTFTIDSGEKIALIGRNGQGKTSLLKLLSGEDTEYSGFIETKKNLSVTLTKQEHILDTTTSALEYILKSVPQYNDFGKILKEFEKGTHANLDQYIRAQEFYTQNGYYYIKDLILNTLKDFQISKEKAEQPLNDLSGGEKRYVELVRMMYSQSDLLLIDEPTNHMDYIGKEQFISWMLMITESILVVTHDRDVLNNVDKIIELKDKKIFIYNGNYDHYLKQNTMQTTSSVKTYQDQLNRLKEAKKRVEWGNQMRAKSKAWKIRYDHWVKDYEKIKTQTVKPSFWIDQESSENLDRKVADSYHKFKEKNIQIKMHQNKDRASELIKVKNLSLGYDFPLFTNVSFSLNNQDRVFIKGRNGAGKSTLIKTILALHRNKPTPVKIFKGEIKFGANLRIGEYEQEIHAKFLPLTLFQAITNVYREQNLPIDDRQINSLLSQYLFDPMVDANQKIADLSGGQKARFQIIKMLSSKPNLLLLDEPTNHLDLPSIEELENALKNYQGGILYISHDTYFINDIGGETVEI